MLSLTKKTDYALIALAHLARQGGAGGDGNCASAREIGTAYGVPLSLLMSLLKTLTRSGLIQSVRGARGGYALARPATKITLATLLEVIEGPIQLVQCAGNTSKSKEEKTPDDPESKSICELMDTCPVQHPAVQVHDRLIQFLRSVTLAELIQSPASGRSGDEPATVGGAVETNQCGCASAPVCSCATEKDASIGTVSETLEEKHHMIRSTGGENAPQETESAKELSHADTYLSR